MWTSLRVKNARGLLVSGSAFRELGSKSSLLPQKYKVEQTDKSPTLEFIRRKQGKPLPLGLERQKVEYRELLLTRAKTQ